MPGKRHGRRHSAGPHPRVFLNCCFQDLNGLVCPLAQFRLTTAARASLELSDVFFLRLRQFGRRLASCQSGESDAPVEDGAAFRGSFSITI